VAVSLAKKRKRSNNDTVSSTTEKTAKLATVVTDTKEKKRIWEVETKNEDF
jgi:hypothetical protein